MHFFDQRRVHEFELRLGRWQKYPPSCFGDESPEHLLAFQRDTRDAADANGVHGDVRLFDGGDDVVDA